MSWVVTISGSRAQTTCTEASPTPSRKNSLKNCALETHAASEIVENSINVRKIHQCARN